MSIGLPMLGGDWRVRAQRGDDATATDSLIAAVFGPGRRAKSAARIREIARAAPAHSGIAAASDGAVLGVCCMWHIEIAGRDGLFLGPLAVADGYRGQGMGAAMVGWCVAQAGPAAMLTIGNLSFFQAWGFVRAPGLRLDVPVRSTRVLARPGPDGHGLSGHVCASKAG